MPATRIDNKTGSIRLTDPASGSRFEIYNANTSGGLTNQYLLSGQAANADGLGNSSRAGLLWGHTAGSLASYLSIETTSVSGVSSEVVRIDSSGNMGIGATPSNRLHVRESHVQTGMFNGAIPTRSQVFTENVAGDCVLYLLNNDTASAAAGNLINNGSLIEFSGKNSSSMPTSNRTFGRIGAFKETNTDLDNAGYLAFYTRSTGASTTMTERMRISSAGAVTIPGNFHSPGTVVQVKTAISGPARQTIASTSPVAITGLSVSFTPKYSNSLIIIEANIASTITYVTSFGVFRDGAKTVSTSGNLNEDGMQITLYGPHGTSANYMFSSTVKHFETSGSTTARTYAIYATSAWLGVVYNLYINNRDTNDMASFSTMTVTEVAQ